MNKSTLYHDSYASPMGRLHFYFDADHCLYGLSLMPAPPGATAYNLREGTGTFLKDQLEEYFRGKRISFQVPLRPTGTSFQQTVWQALREIPYGETRSYQELATMLGQPGASRAVGNAVGANRILICIPCHRVIKSSGALGGFSAGIENKKLLQKLEGILSAPEVVAQP